MVVVRRRTVMMVPMIVTAFRMHMDRGRPCQGPNHNDRNAGAEGPTHGLESTSTSFDCVRGRMRPLKGACLAVAQFADPTACLTFRPTNPVY